MWNIFKVNNNVTDVVLAFLLLTLLTFNIFHTFFIVFIVDFEQVNVGWVVLIFKCIMSQNGQTHLKNFATFAAIFLKGVWPFWDTRY